MAMTPEQAIARHRAYRLLEVLLKVAGMRLSLAQKDFLEAKVHCDQPAIAQAITEIDVAFRDCGRLSNRVRALGIKARVA